MQAEAGSTEISIDSQLQEIESGFFDLLRGRPGDGAMNQGVLLPYFSQLESRPAICWQGRVTQVVGNILESAGPPCSLGECCEVRDAAGHIYSCEVVGFRGTTVLTMPLEKPSGVRYGDPIVARGIRPSVAVGEELLGRVIDGTGRPWMGVPLLARASTGHSTRSAPLALERLPIREPLGCGIRAIDAFLTCGRGQRLGIFGGSGVGKSTLIGMMARGTSADLTVLALVGERGREVGEFLEALGRSGTAKIGGGGLHLGPVALTADSRRAGRHHHCRILLPGGQDMFCWWWIR